MAINNVRGIDHIGLTVEDIDEAEQFLFAGLGARLIYETLNRTMPPFQGPEVERMINGPTGLKISRIRMYNLENGPALELFEYDDIHDRKSPLRGCDSGWQHIALFVDDMNAAVERAVAAGATQLGEPWELSGPESGPGNTFCFIQAPFGALIEFVSYASAPAYERTTPMRRWQP